MEQDFKKTSMREALSSIASLVSTETLKAIDYVSVGTTTEKRITLPFMQENLGEYAVSFESQNNILFVQAKSLKWQNVIARQSLNLNSNHVLVNERESHPKLMCLDIQRNNTNYMIYITC